MTRGGQARTPAIVGFLLAGALLLTIGYLANERRAVLPEATPALRILEPSDGEALHNPVTIHFSTPAPLQLRREGWIAGDLHLHLMLDDREIMPAAESIMATQSGFSWQLDSVPAGRHRIYLTWAGRHHGNLPGPSDTITIDVRP